MKFWRHLLGITQIDKEKNQCIGGENGSTEHSKGNKTVPGKVATARTEDGQIEYQNKHCNINQKDEGT